jgi:hypothetical protein
MRVKLHHRGTDYEFNEDLVNELFNAKKKIGNKKKVKKLNKLSSHHTVNDLREIIKYIHKKQNIKLKEERKQQMALDIIKNIQLVSVLGIRRLMREKLFEKKCSLPNSIKVASTLKSSESKSVYGIKKKDGKMYKIFCGEIFKFHKKNFIVHGISYNYKEYAHISIKRMYSGAIDYFPELNDIKELQNGSFIAWKINELVKVQIQNEKDEDEDPPIVPLPFTDDDTTEDTNNNALSEEENGGGVSTSNNDNYNDNYNDEDDDEDDDNDDDERDNN